MLSILVARFYCTPLRSAPLLAPRPQKFHFKAVDLGCRETRESLLAFQAQGHVWQGPGGSQRLEALH